MVTPDTDTESQNDQDIPNDLLELRAHPVIERVTTTGDTMLNDYFIELTEIEETDLLIPSPIWQAIRDSPAQPLKASPTRNDNPAITLYTSTGITGTNDPHGNTPIDDVLRAPRITDVEHDPVGLGHVRLTYEIEKRDTEKLDQELFRRIYNSRAYILHVIESDGDGNEWDVVLVDRDQTDTETEWTTLSDLLDLNQF